MSTCKDRGRDYTSVRNQFSVRIKIHDVITTALCISRDYFALVKMAFSAAVLVLFSLVVSVSADGKYM